jgi:hypothetical protein
MNVSKRITYREREESHVKKEAKVGIKLQNPRNL